MMQFALIFPYDETIKFIQYLCLFTSVWFVYIQPQQISFHIPAHMMRPSHQIASQLSNIFKF